jgi:D-alanine-D-alanine ligase
MSMNKAVSKMVFQSDGIPTAPFQVLEKKQKSSLSIPFVLKPVDGGSAIGVAIVRKKSEFFSALKSALKYSKLAIVEKFIHGKEVTAPVLGGRVLPLIEIVPKGSFYDFRSKYVKGMSEHILPARVPEKIKREICSLALKVHQALGCRAFSRVDFIVDEKGRPWVLELNSIPGMTETSLFPEAAKAVGLSFPEMLLEIVRHSK